MATHSFSHRILLFPGQMHVIHAVAGEGAAVPDMSEQLIPFCQKSIRKLVIYPGFGSNTAIDSTCEVCGNMLTTPAALRT